MIPPIRIIYQLCRREIFEVISKTEIDMKAWLANQEYWLNTPLQPTNDTRTSEFFLHINSLTNFHAALANDCNRFSQAAIESMWLVQKSNTLPKSAGWSAVQMYYSAFYAAHAILRLFGRVCSHLEKDYVDKVYEIAVATSQDNSVTSIENGFYLSTITGNTIYYKKLKDSHADTWYSFNDLLKWLINNIPSSTTGLGMYKSDAITLLSELKQILTKSGANKGNWLSQTRNKVHYQHTHGLWFPYRGALHNQDLVMKNSEWVNSPTSFNLSNTNDDISILYGASNSILSLMFHLMKYGYELADKISLPLSNGTFRLINQLKVI